MAITTVVGASGQTFTVTVDGSAAQNLAQQYASAVAGLQAGGGFTSYNVSSGNVAGAGSLAQGLISTGGAYNFTGDLSYIAAGSYISESSPTYSLNDPVAINLTSDTASSISVLTGSFGGVTLFAGNQNGLFVGGVGNNAFLGSGKTGNWNVATGNGNDTILGTNGNDTISGGTGQNLIFLGSGKNSVLSEGQDTIYGTSGTDTVSLQGGSSIVQLHANATVFDTSTNNTVTVGSNSTIVGGSSSTYFTTGSGWSSFSGGTGDTISAAGNLVQDAGVANNISVGGTLQFLSGTGSTTITAGTATVWGSTGLVANFTGTSGTSLFVGDQSASGDRSTMAGESFNASSSQTSLIAWVGNNQTVVGGSASDTLTGTTGNSTLTGGSGAANVFQFIDGYAGGDYTITDFGSAAGNLVGLNKYNMTDADVSKMLSNATISGGNTTIQLSDNSKITFLNTTDLKASDFSLWGQS
ncbi:calcium-binding protein [Gluconobacter wancherniae]|uniref:beta strand repeat-containing protein n=1 Tax=Gluconobacter wancherniae TaxID=1307955 RepID=UPI001B8D1C3E|nr:calcium-binding protein [Gluconobacter wancherniae]MBS1062941.1 calcium-binding protein [Gluconobacter wancherniae]